MKTMSNELADKLGDIISAAIQHIHDIFAAHRPAAAVYGSFNFEAPRRCFLRHDLRLTKPCRRTFALGCIADFNSEFARGPKSATKTCVRRSRDPLV